MVIEWENQLRRNTNYMIVYWLCKGTKSLYPIIGLKNSMPNWKAVNKEIHTDKKRLKIMIEELTKGFEKDNEFLHKIIKKSYAICKEVEEIGTEMTEKNFTELTNNELKLVWERIDHTMTRMGPVVTVVFQLDEYLKQELNKRINNEELKQLIQTPIKDNEEAD